MNPSHFKLNSKWKMDDIIFYGTGDGYISSSTANLSATIYHNTGKLILPVVFMSTNNTTWSLANFTTDQNYCLYSADNQKVSITAHLEGWGSNHIYFRLYGYPVDNNSYEPMDAISHFKIDTRYGYDFILKEGSVNMTRHSTWETITTFNYGYLPVVRCWEVGSNSAQPIYDAVVSDGQFLHQQQYTGIKLTNTSLQYANSNGSTSNKIYYKIYGVSQQ